MRDTKPLITLSVALACAALASSCGDDGGPMTSADKDAMSASVGDTGVFGSVIVTLQAGAGVPTVEAGARPGQIVDGWKASYNALFVAFGDFTAEMVDDAGNDRSVRDGRTLLVDLLRLTDGGIALQVFDTVEVGSTTQVGYSLVRAGADAERTGTLGRTDHDRMVKGGYAVYIDGAISHPGGQSCKPGAPKDCVAAPTIRFRWGLPIEASYRDCAPFEVEDGEATNAVLTLVGDRWFQVDFSRAAGERRAQWIADADLDRNGETTVEELGQIRAVDLFTSGRYDLSGADQPVVTALDFLHEQARAMGIAGQGTCRTQASPQ